MSRTALILGCTLVWVSTAAALYTEHKTEEFGPAPEGKPHSDPRYALRHAAGRVSWLQTGWDGWGQVHNEGRVACHGEIDAVNVALADFVTLPSSPKEIRLFPDPGVVRSLDEKITLSCDWQIQWMSHISFPRGERKETTEQHNAVMTIFVARTAPIPKVDPRAEGWIKDLNDDKFAVRQRAFQALADQGDAALPLLRKALERDPPSEQRRRLEQLSARLQSIHVARLKLPKGIPVLSIDELLAQQRQNWSSGNLGKSWEAAEKISAWAEYSADTLPWLVEMLADDREQVRSLAVSAFKRLGKRATPGLPALHSALGRASKFGSLPIRQALQAIEQAPDIAGVDEAWRRNHRLRKDLAEFCRSRKPS